VPKIDGELILERIDDGQSSGKEVAHLVVRAGWIAGRAVLVDCEESLASSRLWLGR